MAKHKDTRPSKSKPNATQRADDADYKEKIVNMVEERAAFRHDKLEQRKD